LIVDADLVQRLPEGGGFEVHRIPATVVADRELGRRIVANMVMLGAVVGITGAVTLGDLEQAVTMMAPKGTADLNLRAVRRGLELSERSAVGELA
jgi:2-oxoglutarate ferredoxin oxidoreductase subunit gamma